MTLYTTAPESYDGFSVEEVLDGRDRSFLGQAVRMMTCLDKDAEWYQLRCGSGNHACMTSAQWAAFVKTGEAQERELAGAAIAQLCTVTIAALCKLMEQLRKEHAFDFMRYCRPDDLRAMHTALCALRAGVYLQDVLKRDAAAQGESSAPKENL